MDIRINLILLILLLSSCFTNSNLSYNDPNYLESSQFNESKTFDLNEESLYDNEDDIQDSSNIENEYDYNI